MSSNTATPAPKNTAMLVHSRNAVREWSVRVAAPAPDPLPRVSLAQAESLAAAWVPDFGPAFATLISQVHWGVVDPASLKRCRLTRYAASQFEPVDPALASDATCKPSECLGWFALRIAGRENGD